MNISDKLTSEKLQEIMLNVYQMGQQSGEMKAQEVIEEIKKQILSAIRT